MAHIRQSQPDSGLDIRQSRSDSGRDSAPEEDGGDGGEEGSDAEGPGDPGGEGGRARQPEGPTSAHAIAMKTRHIIEVRGEQMPFPRPWKMVSPFGILVD